MATRVLKVEVVGDDRSLQRTLGRSEKRMGKFGRAAARAGAGLATAAAAGASYALKEAIEAEKAGKQTAAVLKSTGGAAKVSRKDVEALARSLSLKSGKDDEAIQSGQNLLLTFKNVRNEAGKGNRVFNEATVAALDMATSMTAAGKTTSIASANLQIGKALHDPIKGISALTRVGVTFTQQEKDKIKAMTESGNRLGAQKLILRELRTEFGGSAAANATAGAKLKVAFDDLAESVGKAILPAFNDAAKAGAKFFDQMRTGKGTGGQVASVLKSVGRAVAGVVGFFKQHPTLAKFAGGLVAVGLAVKGIKFAGAVTGVSDLISATRGAPGKIKGALSTVKGIVGRIMGRAGTSGGTALAESAASTAGSSIGPSMGKRRGRFSAAGRSVGGSLGRSAGSTAASTASTAAGDGIVASAGKGGRLGGKFARAGRLAGRLFGVAAAVLIADEIAKAINLDPSEGGKPVRRRTRGNAGFDPIGTLKEAFGLQGGGFIPGARAAADNVPALLSPGEFVLTGHGQQMVEQMAGPGAMSAISRTQAPHFRRGGEVQRFMSGGRVARFAKGAGFRGRGLTTAVAVAGAESGWRQRAVSPTGDYGLWQINHAAHPAYSTGRLLADPAYNAAAAYTISGRGSNWRPWVTFNRGTHKGWLRRARAAIGGSGAGIRGNLRRGERPGMKPAGVSHPLTGSLLQPLIDDALTGGITAGREGASRRPLLEQILEGIAPESGDRATRASGGAGGGGGRRRRRPRGRIRAGGGWGGSENIVRRAVRGFAVSNTKRTPAQNRAVGGATGSDHLTTNRNSFAADFNAGDGPFNTVKRRLGIPASPGSYARHKVPGTNHAAQLLWKVKGHFDHNHLGVRRLRRGGWVGMRRGGRPRSLRRLNRQLAGRPTRRAAARLTKRYSRGVRGRRLPALLKARADIIARIRRMAKNGLTGDERIKVRRLRGALSLIDDELGRPIGAALGGSDLVQEGISRAEGNFDNSLIVGGIDPESPQGQSLKRGFLQSNLGQLQGQRGLVSGALTRARATGNRAAIGEAQTELNELDDQILATQAALVTATNANTEAQANQTAAIKELKEELKKQNAIASSTIGISLREAQRAFADVISSQIGATYSQRAQTAGAGSLARY